MQGPCRRFRFSRGGVARRAFSASMIWSSSGWRAARSRKSTTSSRAAGSASSANTLALRGSPEISAFSPKNCPARRTDACRGRPHLRLAFGNEEHAVARLPLAHDRRVGRARSALSAARAISASAGAPRLRKSGNRTTRSQLFEEIAPAEFLGKAARQYAGPEREEADAGDHHHAGQRAAGEGRWNLVAVTGGGDGRRPPTRLPMARCRKRRVAHCARPGMRSWRQTARRRRTRSSR